MFYQVGILCWAVTAILSAPTDVVPLEKLQPTVIPIISQSEELEPNGTYKFSYETGNGIKREEISFDKIIPKAQGRSGSSAEDGGSDESDEIHVQKGSYSYTAPDGTLITIRYIADENGFQAFGDHLPRAPAPLQISSSLSDKSGRALKSVDSAETASAPVPAVKPESIPEPVKTLPEVAQPTLDIQPKSSEPASVPPALTARNLNDDESKPAPVETTQQSSNTAASESITEAAEQPTAAAEQPTAAAKKSIAAIEQSAVVAEQSTGAVEESTAAAELKTDAAELTTDAAELSTNAVEKSAVITEQSAAAPEQSTAAAELSTSAAEQTTGAAELTIGAAEQTTGATELTTGAAELTTGAAELTTGAAEQTTGAAEQTTGAAEPIVATEQSTTSPEQSTAVAEQSSTAAAEEPATNSAVEEQPSTVADVVQVAPVSNDSQPAAPQESPAPVSAEN